jgi:hypothetical protein
MTRNPETVMHRDTEKSKNDVDTIVGIMEKI